MEGNLDYIYKELRETRNELISYLNKNAAQSNEKIMPYIKAELKDIDDALKKIQYGEYGKCEFSGELLPYEILQIIPTVKSANETAHLERFCRKPLYS